MTKPDYGRYHVEALRTLPHPEAHEAADFLERRLTDAALDGCHHCDEGDSTDAPCWWCGLKVMLEESTNAD